MQPVRERCEVTPDSPPKWRAKSSLRRRLCFVRPARRVDTARSNDARLFTEKNKSCPPRRLRQKANLSFPIMRILGAPDGSLQSRMKSWPHPIRPRPRSQQLIIRGRRLQPKASRSSASVWHRVRDRLFVARSCQRERETSSSWSHSTRMRSRSLRVCHAA